MAWLLLVLGMYLSCFNRCISLSRVRLIKLGYKLFAGNELELFTHPFRSSTFSVLIVTLSPISYWRSSLFYIYMCHHHYYHYCHYHLHLGAYHHHPHYPRHRNESGKDCMHRNESRKVVVIMAEIQVIILEQQVVMFRDHCSKFYPQKIGVWMMA